MESDINFYNFHILEENVQSLQTLLLNNTDPILSELNNDDTDDGCSQLTYFQSNVENINKSKQNQSISSEQRNTSQTNNNRNNLTKEVIDAKQANNLNSLFDNMKYNNYLDTYTFPLLTIPKVIYENIILDSKNSVHFDQTQAVCSHENNLEINRNIKDSSESIINEKMNIHNIRFDSTDNENDNKIVTRINHKQYKNVESTNNVIEINKNGEILTNTNSDIRNNEQNFSQCNYSDQTHTQSTSQFKQKTIKKRYEHCNFTKEFESKNEIIEIDKYKKEKMFEEQDKKIRNDKNKRKKDQVRNNNKNGNRKMKIQEKNVFNLDSHHSSNDSGNHNNILVNTSDCDDFMNKIVLGNIIEEIIENDDATSENLIVRVIGSHNIDTNLILNGIDTNDSKIEIFTTSDSGTNGDFIITNDALNINENVLVRVVDNHNNGNHMFNAIDHNVNGVEVISVNNITSNNIVMNVENILNAIDTGEGVNIISTNDDNTSEIIGVTNENNETIINNTIVETSAEYNDDDEVMKELLILGFADCFDTSNQTDEKQSWICPIVKCTFSTIKLYTFKIHLLKHFNVRPFKCKYQKENNCKWAFYSKSTLQRHYNNVHDKKYEFKCSNEGCSKLFTTRHNLEAHMKRHDKVAALKCDVEGCNAKFVSKMQYEYHKKEHSEIVPTHKCDFTGCIKGFYTLCSLKAHQRTHIDKDKIFVCDICSRKFKAPCRLKEHQNSVHNKIRDYKCTFDNCKWAFATNSKLNRHMQIHTNNKSYKCNINNCNKIFFRSQHLQEHIERHSINRKKYICNYSNCLLQFYARSSLYAHVKKVHCKNKNNSLISLGKNIKQLTAASGGGLNCDDGVGHVGTSGTEEDYFFETDEPLELMLNNVVETDCALTN